MSNGPEVFLLAMMLILPLSALVARRLPFTRIAKLAVLWTLIFAAATAAALMWNSWGVEQ
ncbi:hypothetical protein [Sphingomonas mucosissima]|uniref:Uncharacterized protein n=1 Tax=Sphingomonas mucosissima TaxID=370959 RepID=A0A245ZSM5_9SPHN|nr:hypothetical protein [Sphingomonas mucosissima]OWK32716.1 hypothetical protein SPMU_10570 [Sphingomonas mucosissima]